MNRQCVWYFIILFTIWQQVTPGSTRLHALQAWSTEIKDAICTRSLASIDFIVNETKQVKHLKQLVTADKQATGDHKLTKWRPITDMDTVNDDWSTKYLTLVLLKPYIYIRFQANFTLN